MLSPQRMFSLETYEIIDIQLFLVYKISLDSTKHE